MNEADTCRKFVVPKLQAAGWDSEPHSIAEQRTITDGRIVPVGKGFVRKPPKRADYILCYERNFPLAVVEAKADWQTAGQGIQQAKEYAELLELKFAYATNGNEIVEFDYLTGKESIVPSYPTTSQMLTTGVDMPTCKNVVLARVVGSMSEFNQIIGRGTRVRDEFINSARRDYEPTKSNHLSRDRASRPVSTNRAFAHVANFGSTTQLAVWGADCRFAQN